MGKFSLASSNSYWVGVFLAVFAGGGLLALAFGMLAAIAVEGWQMRQNKEEHHRD